MYEPGTILLKRKQRDPDEETQEPFPYNRVEVIGASPVVRDRDGYTGTEAAGVLLRGLTNFGATLDEPYGKVNKLYEVESIPEIVIDAAPKVRVINSTSGSAGPTPEEVFAVKAPGTAPTEDEIVGTKILPDGTKAPITRGRTPLTGSPLEEPAPAPSILDDPLGEDE